MTMATSTVDRTTSWCPSLQTTTSCPSSSLQVLNDSKFDAGSKKHTSSTNLTILRVIPTRNSLQDLPEAVVTLDDPLDDDDATRNNNTTTTKLTPTKLDGPATPLPYQLELAAISAAIAKMQQRDNEISPQKRDTTATQPFDTKTELAAISAAIDRLKTKWPTDSPPLADPHPPLPAPSTPDSLLDNDGSNHHHDAQRPSSSINDVFNEQTKMFRTINTLLIELLALVNLLLHATKYPATSIPSLPSATAFPSKTTTTICHKIATQLPTINPQTTQIPPWPLSQTNPCNNRIPVKKFSPYRKYIPAKPPFPGRAMTHNGPHAMTRSKDSMRPP